MRYYDDEIDYSFEYKTVFNDLTEEEYVYDDSEEWDSSYNSIREEIVDN